MAATLDDIATVLNDILAQGNASTYLLATLDVKAGDLNQSLTTVTEILTEIRDLSMSGATGGSGGNPPNLPGPVDTFKGEFNKILEGFDRALDTLFKTASLTTDSVNALIGSFNQLSQSVELYDPGKVFLFNLAVRDLTATIGSVLSPIITQATQLMRTLGAVIDGAGPHAKAFGAAMVAAGSAMVAATVAAVALSAAVNSATFGLAATIGAVTGLAAGGASFVAFADDTGQVIESLGELFSEFTVIADMVGETFIMLAQASEPLLTAIAQLIVESLRLSQVTALPGLDLMVIVLENFARAIQIAADNLRVLTDLLEEFGLIQPRGRMGDSTGRATAQATIMSAQQYAERAYTSAFSLGEMSDKEEEKKDRKTLLDHVATIADIAQRWWNKIPDAPKVPEAMGGGNANRPGLDFHDLLFSSLGPAGAAINYFRNR